LNSDVISGRQQVIALRSSMALHWL